ncbi:MAG: YybH family protein [Acidimicrobiales bacterium]
MRTLEEEPSDGVAEVMAVAESLVDAFGRHDVARYFDHFSDDATFVFHTVDHVLRSRREYEELWRVWEAEDGFRVLRCASADGTVRMLGSDAAVFTHRVTTVVSTKGKEETVEERETIVFTRPGPSWLAVHEHLSR